MVLIIGRIRLADYIRFYYFSCVSSECLAQPIRILQKTVANDYWEILIKQPYLADAILKLLEL